MAKLTPVVPPAGLEALIGLLDLLIRPAQMDALVQQLKGVLDDVNAKIADHNVLEDAKAYFTEAQSKLSEAEKRLRSADKFGIEMRAKLERAERDLHQHANEQKQAWETKHVQLERDRREVADRMAALDKQEAQCVARVSETQKLHAQTQAALGEAESRLARIKEAAKSLG